MKMKMNEPESLDDMMRQVLAARGVPVPGDEAPAATDIFTDAFAAPDGAERYQIAVPPGMARDSALEAKARGWFHRAGLPQGAVNGIVQEYCRQLCAGDMPADFANQQRHAQAALTEEWGPDYPRKIAAARALIAKSGGAEELADILDSTGLGDNPWLIRTLAALAEAGPATGGDK